LADLPDFDLKNASAAGGMYFISLSLSRRPIRRLGGGHSPSRIRQKLEV
jgi:hypothetical protein